MIHIRNEGQVIRTGFNFYPLKCNLAGFVFKLGSVVLYARYNKLQGKFKCHYQK